MVPPGITTFDSINNITVDIDVVGGMAALTTNHKEVITWTVKGHFGQVGKCITNIIYKGIFSKNFNAFF